MNGAAALLRVARAARPGRLRLALAALLGAAAIGSGIALLATSGLLIAKAALAPPILTLTVTIVGVRLFALLRATTRYGERIVSHDVALRALATIRARVVRRLVPLVPGGLPGLGAGDLLSRVVADVDRMRDLFVRALGPPVVTLLVLAGAVLAAGLVLPAAGLALALVLGTAALVLPLLTWASGRRAARRQAPARARLTAEIVEALQHAPEIVAYGLEDDRVARVGEADAALARSARRDAVVGGLSGGAVALLAGLAAAAVLVVAIPAAGDGTIDGVALAALALLALASAEAVAPLPEAARHLAGTAAAARRIEEVTDRRPPVEDPPDPVAPPLWAPVLALEGVTAGHPGGPPVLHDVDLVVRPGARIALVGPSGAGKSTALALMVRFLDPSAGRVTLDGRDVRALSQADLRDIVRLSGQDAHVFATTLRENVRIGRPGAGDAAVRDALARAGLGDWVAGLPDGLATPCGEDGARMSGGQRQRLALARALVSGAPVLLLDEPTAHLDAPAARAFVADLTTAARDASVVLVTHSTDGLEGFDEVVVLEEGRIVGRGP
ncbi:MAG: thiol reductant ABC exporter subunit CydC [Thermoleophilia bacterium]